MTFADKLDRAWSVSGGMLCVGLDPVLERMPEACARDPRPVLAFNRMVIDAVGDLVCAFKPQFAHHAALGAERDLAETIAYAHAKAPHAVVILDAKRGDIGTTADMYAREAFERYEADAVTVNPFMGDDTVNPFLAWSDRGVLVLCRTSNPDARRIQGIEVEGEPLFVALARRAETVWNAAGNCMLVVGATDLDDLARVRAAAPSLSLLNPGVGAQGGSASDVVRYGARADGRGLVVSASRSVIEAGGPDAVRAAAERLHAELRLPEPVA
ncbi:MAG: orotidine-5'-phosphate decarboxylase [Alphaproteobacteria bacterium]|jgi:orotidine-5'-phosphate decarboxylase|nr:orotidine-5'-phosphate decarboxylase [Alphaproteobacteria bacterium]